MDLAQSVASSVQRLVEGSGSSETLDLPSDVRVVSVGAVSWGGDGKTAMAAHLASLFARRGLRVGLVTRAHGGNTPRPTRVPGGGLFDRRADVRRCGDEAVMLASMLGNVVVWAGPDRKRSLRAAVGKGLDVVVVDDGLSLAGVRKDLEIALLSSGQRSFKRLPAGPLRRPATDTARAHVIGLRASDSGPESNGFDDEAHRLLDLTGASGLPWFGFRLAAGTRTGACEAYLAAGIARPERFEASARRAGYVPTGRTWFPDHHVPDSRDLEDLASKARATGARIILVTAKDGPRFPELIGDIPVEVLVTRVVVFRNEGVLRHLTEGIVRETLVSGRA